MQIWNILLMTRFFPTELPGKRQPKTQPTVTMNDSLSKTSKSPFFSIATDFSVSKKTYPLGSMSSSCNRNDHETDHLKFSLSLASQKLCNAAMSEVFCFKRRRQSTKQLGTNQRQQAFEVNFFYDKDTETLRGG